MRIILNPEARNGAGGRQRGAIERELQRRNIEFELVQTEGPGHARELGRDAAASGIERIVAAGGDGTVHEVANGIIAAGVGTAALGMIPIGTGNDFVKMIPGVSTREQAYRALQDSHSRAVDVGVVHWDGGSEHFINAMGTGVDVEVVRQMRRSRFLPGGAIYVAALVRALARYRPVAVEMTVDGSSLDHRIMILAVCNGMSIGGAFRICPDASPVDGLFDVCIIGEMPVLRNVRMVPRVISGTHAGQPGVTMLRGRSLLLRTKDAAPLPFQLDGELREAADGSAGLRIEVAAVRLNVIGARPASGVRTRVMT
jgi:diacylglycerol kinase (ATP)